MSECLIMKLAEIFNDNMVLQRDKEVCIFGCGEGELIVDFCGKTYNFLSKTDKWAGSGKGEWKNDTDIMKRCLDYTEKTKKCTGVSVFCYQYYYEPLTNIEIQETKNERDSFTLALKDIQWN